MGKQAFDAPRLQAFYLDPREVVITDVTGDGLADLVLLSQDRVLVYPQDAAPAAAAGAPAAKAPAP